jgi:hypothetical protein
MQGCRMDQKRPGDDAIGDRAPLLARDGARALQASGSVQAAFNRAGNLTGVKTHSLCKPSQARLQLIVECVRGDGRRHKWSP